jgi:hypothetical protein
VKLTWDDDDPERNQITRRAFSRQEIEQADFKAYLASSTSESDTEEGKFGSERNKNNKAAQRDNLRTLLLSNNSSELPEGWGRDEHGGGSDVDMEITFTPGLTGVKNDQDETTLEKYQRKMKEKRKKAKANAVEEGSKLKVQSAAIEDDFFSVDGEKDSEMERPTVPPRKKTGRDDNVSTASTSRVPITAEELTLLMASDNLATEPKHFNMKSVLKAERKGKRGKKKGAEDNDIQEDFTIDVKDDRFKALHEDHAFAIDPSNPQ